MHVFDLAADTNAPLCVQKVVRKAHLTRLAFNPKHPVLVVGDDRRVPSAVEMYSIRSGAVACLHVGYGLGQGPRQLERFG